ncbi:hypothetical protein ACLB2K_025508 [Fragaria x ananassa]
MSQILSWNCQGLGRALIVHKLRELIRSHSLSVVFLCETKQSNFRVNRLRRQFKFYKGETVLPSRISAGGLAIWWCPEVDVISRSQNLIDTVIKFSSVDAPTRVTFFYGPPYNEDKLPFWSSIENLAFSNPSVWVCIGDFNKVASMDEEGGVSWSWSITRFLRNFMENNGLLDLHFTGPRLTWENKREDVNEIIRERLDQAIGNAEWLHDWPESFVKHEPRIGSDHCPMILYFQEKVVRFKKPFRFEASWVKDPDCDEVVAACWKSKCSNPFRRWSENLESCKSGLARSSKAMFPNNKLRVERLQNALLALQEGPVSCDSKEKEQALLQEINHTWNLEESF